MEPGHLVMVEVTNRSESMERYEQMMHTLEQINKQESLFKHQKWSKTIHWSVHVKRMHGDQLVDHPQCSYHNFYYYVIPLNTPGQVSSEGGIAIAWNIFLIRSPDYECSILVYQTHVSDGMQCSGIHRAWKENLNRTAISHWVTLPVGPWWRWSCCIE